jgi:hypothetical protein
MWSVAPGCGRWRCQNGLMRHKVVNTARIDDGPDPKEPHRRGAELLIGRDGRKRLSSGKPALKTTVPVMFSASGEGKNTNSTRPDRARPMASTITIDKRDRQGDIAPVPGQLHQPGKGDHRGNCQTPVEATPKAALAGMDRSGRQERSCDLGLLRRLRTSSIHSSIALPEQRDRHHDCHPPIDGSSANPRAAARKPLSFGAERQIDRKPPRQPGQETRQAPATRNWRHQDQPGGLRPASELAR